MTLQNTAVSKHHLIRADPQRHQTLAIVAQVLVPCAFRAPASSDVHLVTLLVRLENTERATIPSKEMALAQEADICRPRPALQNLRQASVSKEYLFEKQVNWLSAVLAVRRLLTAVLALHRLLKVVQSVRRRAEC